MTEVLLEAGPNLQRPNGDFIWTRMRQARDAKNKVVSTTFGRWAFAGKQLPHLTYETDRVAIRAFRVRERRAEQARQSMMDRPFYYGLAKSVVKRLKLDQWPQPTARRVFIKQRKRDRLAGAA